LHVGRDRKKPLEARVTRSSSDDRRGEIQLNNNRAGVARDGRAVIGQSRIDAHNCSRPAGTEPRARAQVARLVAADHDDTHVLHVSGHRRHDPPNPPASAIAAEPAGPRGRIHVS